MNQQKPSPPQKMVATTYSHEDPDLDILCRQQSDAGDDEVCPDWYKANCDINKSDPCFKRHFYWGNVQYYDDDPSAKNTLLTRMQGQGQYLIREFRDRTLTHDQLQDYLAQDHPSGVGIAIAVKDIRVWKNIVKQSRKPAYEHRNMNRLKLLKSAILDNCAALCEDRHQKVLELRKQGNLVDNSDGKNDNDNEASDDVNSENRQDEEQKEHQTQSPPSTPPRK